MKLYPLDMGVLGMDQSNFTPGRGVGIATQVPVSAFLMTHPKGNVLFDTGMDPAVMTDLRGTWGVLADMLTVQITGGQTILSQLRLLGYQPRDIDHVVISHLHMDHAGGIQFFPDAEFLVQKAELRAAFRPEPYERHAYVRSDFDRPVNYNDIEGDYDLFGDEKLIIRYTPGHSQGHQSLEVNLDSGAKFVLCADACYEATNIRPTHPFGYRLEPTGIDSDSEEAPVLQRQAESLLGIRT